jgi:DNA-binding NarL/FixJ family response regulator
MSNAKRVVIIDEKQQGREGLAALINNAAGFQCVDTFESIEVALEKTNSQNTDLILVDISVHGISGIKKKNPNLPFLVLSVYEDDDRIFEALCAGASGYLLKKALPIQLLEGLREVVNGGAPMSPEVAGRVIKYFREIRPSQNQLTSDETKILELLVEGHNYKTAAAELGVSGNAISFAVKQIYEKLQLLAAVASFQ